MALKIFGERIKMLREERGLTLRDVALELGIAHTSLHYYETGKQDGNIELLIKVSKFYNVDPNWLLGLKDKRGMFKDEEKKG